MIDLISYLTNFPTDYVIVRKSSNFPKYQTNTDLDILCYNLTSIVEYSKNYLTSNRFPYSIQIPENHYHIDILNSNGSLHLKLDFIESLSLYKKFSIPDIVFNEIFNTKIINQGIYEPSNEYDLLLRYLEYKEFISERPGKLKHLNYIKQYPNGINIVNDLLKKHNITEK
jgi:hypothetical protein